MQIHGKEITTIVSDLDGTLLGQGQLLPEDFFDLYEQLKVRGVDFIVASGRQYKNMRLLFESIAQEIPFVCENGSLIVEKDETVFVKNIPREIAFELLADMLTIPDTETIVSSERSLYTLSSRMGFVEKMNYILRPRLETIDRYELISGDINKISIWWETGIPKKEEAWFHEKYDSRLQVVDGGNGWLDFTMQGVNKGTALRELAKLENIDLSKALCFGDNENDVAMFRECAVSYAMSTSKPEVKAAADFVCEKVDEELKRFLNSQDPR